MRRPTGPAPAHIGAQHPVGAGDQKAQFGEVGEEFDQHVRAGPGAASIGPHMIDEARLDAGGQQRDACALAKALRNSESTPAAATPARHSVHRQALSFETLLDCATRDPVRGAGLRLFVNAQTGRAAANSLLRC